MTLPASIDRVTPADAAGPEADLALVRRARAGDAEAFGALVERHRRAVLRAAAAALGSTTDADDVAQEAFVTAFRKLDGFRGEASFRTWLLTITWRKAIDRRQSLASWWRRLAPHGATGPGESTDPMDRVANTDRSQEDGLMVAEFQQRLRGLIAALPKKLRDPLLLAGSGDYSYEEIGHVLKIPVGTVKWRISEARRVLKQKMRATGLAR